MAVIDWTDPCARYAALQQAYFTLLSGGAGAETLIRTRSEHTEREVRYSAGNLKVLKSELDAAERACAAKNGTLLPRQRFAIRGGARYQGCR